MRHRISALLAVVMVLTCISAPAAAASDGPAEDAPIEDAFTDPVFLNEVREITGKTNGEHIYRSDVENITELILVDQGWDHIEPTIDTHLTSMDGIEYFTGLKVLYCYGNDFAELDVTHNPNLELLDCSYTYIKELDLSNCPKLNFLDCNATDLEELDLSHCPELNTLYCGYTYLQSLDVSGNPKLTTLSCCETFLKTLDLSHNPLLEEVEAWGMHLVTLDVSNNSRLRSLELEYNDMCAADSVVGLENCAALETFGFEPQNTVREGHSWDSGAVTLAPTCTEKGEMTYTCVNCAMTKTEEIAPAGQHEPGTAWETDGTSHWHVCIACGEALEKSAHIYDGDEDADCNVCGHRRSVAPNTPSSSYDDSSDSYDDDSDSKDTAPKTADKEPERTVCPKDESCPICPYTDAAPAEWYHDGLHYCLEKGLLVGYRDGTLGPDGTLTRGMLAQILYNEAGRPAVSGRAPFDDVAPQAGDADAVAWAAEKNIVKGYKNGTFGPGDPVTREQLALILHRHAGSPAPRSLELAFGDAKDAGGFAWAGLCWAVEEGIIEGTEDGSLAPKGEATRAEAAAMLQRYLSE